MLRNYPRNDGFVKGENGGEKDEEFRVNITTCCLYNMLELIFNSLNKIIEEQGSMNIGFEGLRLLTNDSKLCRRFQTIFDCAADGIFTTDKDRRINSMKLGVAVRKELDRKLRWQRISIKQYGMEGADFLA
jgi:PAS domain-containing protein